MKYLCCDERRRNAVRAHSTLNGIEFLEVLDDPNDPVEQRQRTLFVHFIKDLAADALTAANLRIEGGERIRNIAITEIAIGPGSPPASPPTEANVLTIEVAEPGDFSVYTLRLIRDADDPRPPEGFDPILSAVDFSFKVACPSDFDCQITRSCPAEQQPPPEISYLAKDYASFRQLMLDRMAVLLPAWTERSPADLGIALIELLAYVGDYLSYQQDAVATEAYLGTARRRTSVRRHTRLVDYRMHDGANARAWVQLRVRPDINGLPLLPRTATNGITRLLTRVESLPRVIGLDSAAYERALAARPEVFELLHDITLFSAHNELFFYTWGARECCLPKGAVRATLRGAHPDLQAGNILVLAEVVGPHTGESGDADRSHRHAVRLTRVEVTSDPLGGRFLDEPVDDAVPVTEIEWDVADALPFPLCVSARRGTDFFEDVSVALGNIVLADHGRTIELEQLPAVPNANPALTKVSLATGDRCQERTLPATPPRFRPRLREGSVTQAGPYDPENPSLPAAAARRSSLSNAVPAITLALPLEGPDLWQPRRDLLASGPSDRHFVVEVEADRTTYLRFGDDRFGSRPASGTEFRATYRVGNGTAGNVGAGAIWHIASDDPAIISDTLDPVIVEVRNPLPAEGGQEMESIEEARQNAPSAFRIQERAVTPEDYAEIAQRCDSTVQRAAATFRWTGSWHTVFLTADRRGGADVDAPFETQLRQCLEKYRMAGHDLEVDGPRFVPLAIDMVVCVKPDYFVGDVKTALIEVFSSRKMPDGTLGVFHSDNFTFGQTVYLSRLYAAAQNVEGVLSVTITKFQRQGTPSSEALDAGKLELGRLEIARLDNDPNFRERGVLRLIMQGGR